MTALGWACVLVLAVVVPTNCWMFRLLRDPNRNPRGLALYFRNTVAVTGLTYAQARRSTLPFVYMGVAATLLCVTTVLREFFGIVHITLLLLPLAAFTFVSLWMLLAIRAQGSRRWGPRAFENMSDKEFETWVKSRVVDDSSGRSRGPRKRPC